MKNKTAIILLSSALIFSLFSGCSKTDMPSPEKPPVVVPPAQKTAFDKIYGANKEGDILIVNNKDKIGDIKITNDEKIVVDGEQVYIVPRDENTYISICEVVYEDGKIYTGRTIYQNERTPKDFVLGTKIIRAEGIPSYMLVAHSPDGYAEYVFSYDGKDGTADIEVVTLTKFGTDSAFNYNEMGYWLHGSEKTFTSELGEPKTREKIDFLIGGKATKLIYDGAEIEMVGETGGTIYHTIMWSPKLKYLRDVKIGDKIDSVIKKFKNVGEGEKILSDDVKNGGNAYAMLYGEWIHMSDYGMIEYLGDKPVCLNYSNEGTSVIFYMSDGVVSKIAYEIPVA